MTFICVLLSALNAALAYLNHASGRRIGTSVNLAAAVVCGLVALVFGNQ